MSSLAAEKEISQGANEDESAASIVSTQTKFARRPSVLTSNTTSSTGAGGIAVFGGGKGWESWGTEEGHRALGQAYQRNNGGSASTGDNSYDVDEFGDLVSSTGSSLRNRGMAEESDTSTGTEGTDRRRSEASNTNTSSSHQNSSSSEEDSAVRSGSSSSGDSPNTTAVHSRGYYSESVLHDKVIRPNLETKSSGLIPGLRTKFGKNHRSASWIGRTSFMKGMDDDDNKTHKMSLSIVEGDETASNADDNNCKDLRKPLFKSCSPECWRKSQIICVSVLLLSGIGAILLGTLLPEGSSTKQNVRHVAKASSQAVSHLLGMEKEIKVEGEGSEIPMVEEAPRDRRTTSTSTDLSIYLPESSFINYVNVWEPHQQTDSPVYWHVPRAGGKTVTDILTNCYGLGVGFGVEDLGDESVLNVHAYEDLHHASTLFDETHKGRVFALIRHPVDRAISAFNYRQQDITDPNYDESLASMSILDYIQSNLADDNWMVRTLTNNFENPINAQDVEVAKQFLRQKIFVGFLELFDESMDRFQQFFNWPFTTGTEDCQKVKSQMGNINHTEPRTAPTHEDYDELEKLNWADMELYGYAETLFQEQAQLLIPSLESVQV